MIFTTDDKTNYDLFYQHIPVSHNLNIDYICITYSRCDLCLVKDPVMLLYTVQGPWFSLVTPLVVTVLFDHTRGIVFRQKIVP